jgi:RNA polymerase sigma factor (sigma-70 family)
MKLGEEVSAGELAEAWQGFCRWLHWKRFSCQFIWNDGADMFAQAQLALSQALARGIEIRCPPGWLVHCALQRTKNLLEKRTRAPSMVSEERIGPLKSEELTPEEELLEDEWRHSLRDAISSLRAPEREIIELVYFNEMSCRAAARALGWASSKAHRNHRRALRRLRPFFGRIESEEVLLGRPGPEEEGSP